MFVGKGSASDGLFKLNVVSLMPEVRQRDRKFSVNMKFPISWETYASVKGQQQCQQRWQ